MITQFVKNTLTTVGYTTLKLILTRDGWWYRWAGFLPAFIISAMTCAVILFTSLLLLQSEIIPDLRWINAVLNFSPEGRYTGAKPEGMGIAVLGDSHAVGWGIGDEETFSVKLQRLSARPVYDLAVPS